MIDPNIITTVRVDQLTPDVIGLTDLFPFETVDDQALKHATFQDLINFINIHSSALQYEVKRMSVTQLYIDNNFDVTGLGTNLCAGFAICNGQNGTENLDGLVGVGFGTVQNNIGGFGGEKEHTLKLTEIPAHKHSTSFNDYTRSGGGSNTPVAISGTDHVVDTSTAGGGLAHNNMQPYIVQLYMMKL